MTSEFWLIFRRWYASQTWIDSHFIAGLLHHDYFAVTQNDHADYLLGMAIDNSDPCRLAEKNCVYDRTIFHTKLRAWFAWFGHGRDPAE